MVDLWVNALSASAARAFTGQAANQGIPELFGTDLSAGTPLGGLVETMDRCGVDLGVLAGGLSSAATPGLLASAEGLPGRFLVAAVADDPEAPVEQVARLRDLASHPCLALARVTPLVHQYPINHRLYYPLYAACCELGLPVSINVGVPGPRVRSACQHPELLEDVLIDFPGLVVIGAHMGHPYEALLMGYLLKWPSLFLSTSAYLARYMDPALVRFMGSSRGRGRVLFASDHPFLDMERAIEAARALPLDQAAMAAFLGGTARRLLTRG